MAVQIFLNPIKDSSCLRTPAVPFVGDVSSSLPDVSSPLPSCRASHVKEKCSHATTPLPVEQAMCKEPTGGPQCHGFGTRLYVQIAKCELCRTFRPGHASSTYGQSSVALLRRHKALMHECASLLTAVSISCRAANAFGRRTAYRNTL